jgi:hypothetical protein
VREKSYTSQLPVNYGNLVAWNWQIFEMRQAHKTLVLYKPDDRRPEAGALVRMSFHPTRNKKPKASSSGRGWRNIAH